ncbi:MAG TPA: glycoside hydrolase domain-containing protein [Streptosporangiaceae bacterium]|nr:glycoside hydrolase domain-containing protein [Streptosporangiaceae bacterium]
MRVVAIVAVTAGLSLAVGGGIGIAGHEGGFQTGKGTPAIGSAAAGLISQPRAATKIIRYDGYSLTVPAPWPVYRLGRRSTRCVRYDKHAVYLGAPGINQLCPAHLAGRVATLTLQPGAAGFPWQRSGARGGPGRMSMPQVGAGVSADTQDHELVASIRHPALSVTATYSSAPGQVLGIMHSVRRIAGQARYGTAARGGAGHPETVAAARQQPRPALPNPATVRRHGFDSCTAPSVAVMRAWREVFSKAAIYIGGPEVACATGHLSASWIRSVTRLGWGLMPSYVGPQASCSSYSVRINPKTAARQGRRAAADAIRHASALGIGRSSPIYYDIEAYDTSRKACRHSALTFLDAWTRRLHAGGYISGVYSSAGSAAQQLASRTSIDGHRLAEPDTLWFALWNNKRNLDAEPYVPDSLWTGDHRIHQFLGPHKRTVNGYTLNIDSDWVHGAVYR